MAKKKIKQSVFLITISPNKVDMSPEKEKEFTDSISDIFKNNLKNILYEKRPDQEFSENKIKSYSVKYSIEKGKIKGRIHAHILLDISHEMILGINHQPIREYYEEMFGSKVHINIQATGNNVKAMSEYIFKDV